MINYQEAIRKITDVAASRRAKTEMVAIEDCVGRILAREVLGDEPVPSFDNSAMDGFVVNAAATVGASEAHPLRLHVHKTIVAGDTPGGEAASGAQAVAPAAPLIGAPNIAYEIMTGAPIPAGPFDAVVKVEDVQVLGGPEAMEILISAPVVEGNNIRRAGEDFMQGQKVAGVGTRLGAQHVMACAALGIANVEVYRRPRIAVISTGRELVHHSVSRLDPGMIRNSTGPFLMATLQEMGVEAKFYGVVPDDESVWAGLIDSVMADQPDIVLTTGAVSMGKHDFVKSALEKMGAEIVFHKVAIRPGKPLLFAKFAHVPTVVFGVPGNPISTAVGLRFFISPYLRARFGLPAEQPQRARLVNGVAKKPEDLKCFFKGSLRATENGLEATLFKGQASFMISPFLVSNSWLVFPEALAKIEVGQTVEVFSLNHEWQGGEWL